MSISPANITTEQEDQMFRLLRQIDLAPNASQRVIALAISVSLGRLNALLRVATKTGLVCISARNSTDKRARFAYGDHHAWGCRKEPTYRKVSCAQIG